MEKIQLRKVSLEWAEQIYMLINKEEVYKYLDLSIESYPMFKKWLQEIEWSEALGTAFHRLIYTEDGLLVGGIFLYNIDHEKRHAEMGTWLGKEFWGKGYNELAKKEMLSIAFTKLKLETILLFVDCNNKRSVNSLKKLNYLSEDTKRKYQSLKKYKEYKLAKSLELFIVHKTKFVAILNEVNS